MCAVWTSVGSDTIQPDPQMGAKMAGLGVPVCDTPEFGFF